MAVKYQLCLCSKPRELLLVTLNHFDVIRSYVNDLPNGQILMEQAYKRISKVCILLHDEITQFLIKFYSNF